MRRRINNIISVIYTLLRLVILKVLNWKNLRFHLVERFSPNVVLEANRGSKVILGKKVRIHSGSKVKCRKGARLSIGNDVKINYNCIIACHDEISIGDNTEFGPSVYLYDHDHDYRVGLSANKFRKAPIKIGENCWIGANSIILKGTELGDNCVVAAGSVISGIYPANSLIYQKRETAVKIIEYSSGF